jgi:hypothetical protein
LFRFTSSVAVLGATLLTATLTTLAPAAFAETRSKTDGADHVAAKINLKRVTWNYSARRLVMTAKLGKIGNDVQVSTHFSHAGEGYEVASTSVWADGRKSQYLAMAYNVGDWVSVKCPHMRSTRDKQTRTVKVSIPNSCLFDGYELNRPMVYTGLLGDQPGIDRILIRHTLSSD